MTNHEFTCWLKGYFQLEGAEASLTWKQLRIIKNHLSLVKEVDGYIRNDNRLLSELLTKTFSENNVDNAFLADIGNSMRNHYLLEP